MIFNLRQMSDLELSTLYTSLVTIPAGSFGQAKSLQHNSVNSVAKEIIRRERIAASE